MDSRLGRYLWALLPNVRRRVDNSVLGGLLDALGEVLDAAKDRIQSLRRRAAVWEVDGSHAYYADSERGQDLEKHALDRGTRRLAGEDDAALRARLQAWPASRRFVGSAIGMQYLVEDVLGHTLAGLVVFRDDPQGWIILSAEEQSEFADRDVSHILSAADQADEDYNPYRQNRIYSAADLDYRFQFRMSIEHTGPMTDAEKERITELIALEKPAHTTFRVEFVES